MGFFDNLYKKAVDVISDPLEDGKEILQLHQDFADLYEVKEYFNKQKEDLNDIGVMDVISETKHVSDKIGAANQKIEQAIRGVQHIQTTKLRFSHDYLGESIKLLQAALDDLDGTLVSLFNYVVNPDTFAGRVAKKMLSKEKMDELTNLSLQIQTLKTNARTLKVSLESLIDPDPFLETPSNNKFLNPLLSADTEIDRIKDVMDTLQKMKEMKDKLGL